MRDEKGFVLVLSMLMIVVLTLIGLASMSSSIFEIKLAGNDLLKKQAFYNAESGLNLYRYDLVNGIIIDSSPTNPKIVYYDMGNVSNPNSPYTIKLNGAKGSGILLVNGDLELGGGFQWYGIVVVTGSIKFAGGGQAITITGGVLAGKDASADSDISGNINILYCSAVKDFLKKTVKATKKLSWREIF